MIRESIDRAVARGELGRGAGLHGGKLNAIKAQYGARALGGITSSRCTNEETFLVQKLVRAGIRFEQCRYLRARLPLAHRLWLEDHLRTSAGRRISIR
jgi:hypothetical protein